MILVESKMLAEDRMLAEDKIFEGDRTPGVGKMQKQGKLAAWDRNLAVDWEQGGQQGFVPPLLEGWVEQDLL